jgi:hypothetical protein
MSFAYASCQEEVEDPNRGILIKMYETWDDLPTTAIATICLECWYTTSQTGGGIQSLTSFSRTHTKLDLAEANSLNSLERSVKISALSILLA